MPTNLFELDPALKARSEGIQSDARRSRINAQNMIQGMAPRVMEDLDERRQQGRGKYAEDIAQEQAQTAQTREATLGQQITNAIAAYHHGQETGYYDSLRTPEGQTMFKSFQEHSGSPYRGPLTNPQQIKDFGEMSKLNEQNKRIAELILQYNPGGTGPEIDWAKHTLGVPVAPPAAPVASTKTTSTGTGRNAFQVFMNRALPTGIGTGGAIAAGSRAPGGWPGKLAVGAGVGFLGDRLTRMALGDLTPEEELEHPWAARAGDVAGLVTGAAAGGKGIGKGVNTQNLAAGLASPIGFRLKPGYVPNPNVGGTRPINTRSGVGQSAARMRTPIVVAPNQPTPASATPMRVGPIPMGNQPVATPPLSPSVNIPRPGGPIPMGNQPVSTPPVSPPLPIPGVGPIPMGNQPVATPGLAPQAMIPPNPQLEKFIRDMMQGPQLPTTGPGVADPQLQLFIRDLFKKVQPGPPPPPLVNP